MKYTHYIWIEEIADCKHYRIDENENLEFYYSPYHEWIGSCYENLKELKQDAKQSNAKLIKINF